ncbi:MAG: LysM peptidoglycan-binding domain-containing protein, partial [Atribacterota bacterium]
MWDERFFSRLMKTSLITVSTCVILSASPHHVLASTFHTVRPGDSLWNISKHYQIPLDKILQINGLTDSIVLQIGQRIKISNEEQTRAPFFYEVKSGDNLWTIAKRYGVPVKTLLQDNNLPENAVLQIGQKIKINSSKMNGSVSLPGVTSQPRGKTRTIHVIQNGDSLWAISRIYGVSIKSILQVNNLKEDSVLPIGMKLSILTLKNTESEPEVLVAQKNAPSSQKEGGFFHTVNVGDTLWNISRKYGVSINTLAQVNKLKSVDSLQLNQKIWVSSSERPSATKTDPGRYQVYRVKPGDSLWILSKKYRVSMELLMNVNGLNQKSQLRIGQEVRIPAYLSGNYGDVSGDYVWPLMGWVSSRFGPRGRRIHTGVDISAPSGRIIRAARSGVVVFSGWMANYGRAVIVSHSDGAQTLYAHNSLNLVTRGQRVNQGDPIGKVGATGNATGNHCHF